MRTLFFGTPSFAVPCLDALCETTDVVGVVCQPDRPTGRGLVLAPPPVKVRALGRGLEVIQPTKLRNGELAAWARAKSADVALVVAYGRILPRDVLDATQRGFLNVHASLLPKYRGAAPITWAIVNGETKTGVTLIVLDEGMDTGDMLDRVETPIGRDETAGELSLRLSVLGADLVRAKLEAFVQGALPRVPQDSAHATTAPILEKKDGLVDFGEGEQRAHDRIRGMTPWPGAFTTRGGVVVKLFGSRVTGLRREGEVSPGTIVVADKSRVLVACGAHGEETLELVRVQLPGKKPVTACDWVAGRGVREGDVLGRSSPSQEEEARPKDDDGMTS